jgi:hypothetical protein
MMSTHSDASLRRQALQIASMLPSEPEAAKKVLAYVTELMRFLARQRRPTKMRGQGQTVVRFPGGPSSPRRRASSRVKPPGLPK